MKKAFNFSVHDIANVVRKTLATNILFTSK